MRKLAVALILGIASLVAVDVASCQSPEICIRPDTFEPLTGRVEAFQPAEPFGDCPPAAVCETPKPDPPPMAQPAGLLAEHLVEVWRQVWPEYAPQLWNRWTYTGPLLSQCRITYATSTAADCWAWSMEALGEYFAGSFVRPICYSTGVGDEGRRNVVRVGTQPGGTLVGWMLRDGHLDGIRLGACPVEASLAEQVAAAALPPAPEDIPDDPPGDTLVLYLMRVGP